MGTTTKFGIDHLTVVPRDPRPDGDTAGPGPELEGSADRDVDVDASDPDL